MSVDGINSEREHRFEDISHFWIPLTSPTTSWSSKSSIVKLLAKPTDGEFDVIPLVSVKCVTPFPRFNLVQRESLRINRMIKAVPFVVPFFESGTIKIICSSSIMIAANAGISSTRAGMNNYGHDIQQ